MMGFMSLLVLVYCIWILTYTFRFKAFHRKEIQLVEPKTSFSIIIPFRNEESHLPQILESITQLKYPSHLFEVILVDDDSSDHSKTICNEWKAAESELNILILDNQKLAKSPKKSAVLSALQKVNKDYILTTDADCLLPENWLRLYDSIIQHQPSDLIAGPVKIVEGKNFWTKFQVLDMMSLQVIGLGSFKTPSPLFCNAANLCYKAKTLIELQSFDSHKDIISGDDVFNLEAFLQLQKTVNALVKSEATVWTKAEKSFKDLTQQRIRWASKARYYKNRWTTILGLIVLLTNTGLTLSLVFAFILKDFRFFYWLWLFKLGIDFYVLYIGNSFFKINLCLRDYVVMLLIYPFVSTYFGVLALKGNFRWKDRDFRV